MDRLGGGAEVPRERREPEVRHFVADEPTGEADGVDPRVAQPVVAVRGERGVEERGVEAEVVAGEDEVGGGLAEELEEVRERVGDRRRRDTPSPR